MTEQSSSLQNDIGPRASLRDLGRFVLRPRLPTRIPRFSAAALPRVFKLYALDMVLMCLMLGAFLAVEMAGTEMPSNAFDEIDLGLGWIAAIVLCAPVAEELAFRGWLSGRLGALLGAPIAAVGVFSLAAALVAAPGTGDMAGMTIGGGAFVALGAVLAFWLRNRGPYRWFTWTFPLLFWFSCIAFAAIHLGNYEDTDQMLWPLVIPQFLAGIIFAYARVKHGLWSSMLLHALHNGTFVALVLVAEAMAPAA